MEVCDLVRSILSRIISAFSVKNGKLQRKRFFFANCKNVIIATSKCVYIRWDAIAYVETHLDTFNVFNYVETQLRTLQCVCIRQNAFSYVKTCLHTLKIFPNDLILDKRKSFKEDCPIHLQRYVRKNFTVFFSFNYRSRNFFPKENKKNSHNKEYKMWTK